MTIGFNFIVHFLGETGLRGFFQLVANDGEDAEDQTCKNHICLFFWTNISIIFSQNWHHIGNKHQPHLSTIGNNIMAISLVGIFCFD